MAETQDTVFDSGQQHLGTVYAKALLGASEKTGATAGVLDELDSLVDDVLDRLPRLDAALSSPRIAIEEQLDLLDKAFSGRMSALLLTFLKVVARHGRLNCLRAIRRAARRLDNEMHQRVEVQVKTAEPVGSDLLAEITNRLQAALASPLDVQTTVDPSLIGGVVVRVGDTLYDGSVANRLSRLRAETLEKAAHQIRESIDRFAE